MGFHINLATLNMCSVQTLQHGRHLETAWSPGLPREGRTREKEGTGAKYSLNRRKEELSSFHPLAGICFLIENV